MRIQCPHCPAVYELDDGRVPPAGLSIKCPKCKSAFIVHRPEDGSQMARTTAAKVPLPGTPKAAAAKGAAPQKGKGNAIPLPGTPQASARAAAPAKRAAAIPLPGTQTKLKKAPAAKPAPAAARPASTAAPVPAPEDAPTEQIGDDAIPLPGLDSSNAAGAQASATQSEIPLPQAAAEEAPLQVERSSTPQPDRAEIRLPGARRGESATPSRGNEVPLPGARRATPIPVMEPTQAPAPRPSPTPVPRIERQPVATPSQQEALPLPGLDSPLPTPAPAPAAKPERARATPARQARVPTPAASDLLPDLADELAAPAAPVAIDLPPPPAPARRATPAASFKLPDEETALTPKVAVDDTALAPKSGLDPTDFAGPQHGHIPDPSGIDFELARPTPISSSPSPGRVPTPFPERLPTPVPSTRLPTPPSSMPAGAEEESLQIHEAPRTGRTRVAPPVIAPRPPLTARPGTRRAPGEEGDAKGPSPLGALRTALRNPMFAIATVAAIAVAGVFYFGIRAGSTPAGYFWTGKLLRRAKTGAAVSQAIAAAEAKLGRGTFGSDREALATAAQLLASAPEDDETRAFFVLCASEMKLAHGQSAADWDLAKRTVEKMKGSGATQERARGAFALANGDAVKARQLLAPREGRDVESSWLYALSLARSGDTVHASQVLDAAVKARPLPKLLVARGRVAKQRGAPDAAQFFEKALAAAPDYGPALIELADVKLRGRDVGGAEQLLGKVLGSDVRKTLDAGDEARATMLRGRILLARHQTADAEAAFDRALQLDPGSAEIHAAYGAYRLSRHDWEKARKQLEAAVAVDPGNAPLLGDLATAVLGLNQPLEADKRIAEAISKDPQNAHLYYVQGRVYETFGKQLDAMKAYDNALSKKPGSVEAITAQGMLLVKTDKAKAKEKFDTALAAKDRSLAEESAVGELALALGDAAQGKDAFTRALQMDPGDPQAHAGLGRAYAALGDLSSAKTELETALRSMESDPVLNYEYGSLQRRVGDLPSAIDFLQRAVKLDEKDGRFRARLGAAYVDHGEFQKGETELRQARLSDPNSGEALFYLARALAGEGKLADAVDNMRKAVELQPDNAEYLYNLGLLYERAQQVQDAVESFRKSVARDPRNVDAYEHLGQNLLIENRFNEAVKAFTTGAELDPKRSRLLTEVADAEQQAGDLDGAIASFQKSLAQDPSQPGVWSKLGIAYKDKGCNGCKNKAIDALLSAEKVDAKDWVAHRELGYLYKDDGKRQQAIDHFKKYLVLRPDAPDIETVRDEVYYLQEETRRSP